jgi:hypothetical protein
MMTPQEALGAAGQALRALKQGTSDGAILALLKQVESACRDLETAYREAKQDAFESKDEFGRFGAEIADLKRRMNEMRESQAKEIAERAAVHEQEMKTLRQKLEAVTQTEKQAPDKVFDFLQSMKEKQDRFR